MWLFSLVNLLRADLVMKAEKEPWRLGEASCCPQRHGRVCTAHTETGAARAGEQLLAELAQRGRPPLPPPPVLGWVAHRAERRPPLKHRVGRALEPRFQYECSPDSSASTYIWCPLEGHSRSEENNASLLLVLAHLCFTAALTLKLQ